MKNQALFSSKDKSKKLKCRLLQVLCGALRVNYLKHRIPFIEYRISLDIRRIFSFQNNRKDLDPSYKMDLDL